MSGPIRLTLLPSMVAVLLIAAGCGLVLGRGPQEPRGQTPAPVCGPVQIDASTESLWAEALVRFIEPQQMPHACILIRTEECYQDPPPGVLDRLRDKDPRLRTWSFQCQTGVPTISLRDEQGSDGRTITVGDGFQVTCRWGVRRRWLPWQGRLKSLGCRREAGAQPSPPAS